MLIGTKGFRQYESPLLPYLLKLVAFLTHYNDNKQSCSTQTDICFAFNERTFFVHNQICMVSFRVGKCLLVDGWRLKETIQFNKMAENKVIQITNFCENEILRLENNLWITHATLAEKTRRVFFLLPRKF